MTLLTKLFRIQFAILGLLLVGGGAFLMLQMNGGTVLGLVAEGMGLIALTIAFLMGKKA